MAKCAICGAEITDTRWSTDDDAVLLCSAICLLRDEAGVPGLEEYPFGWWMRKAIDEIENMLAEKDKEIEGLKLEMDRYARGDWG